MNKQVFTREEDEKIIQILKEKTQSRDVFRQLFNNRSIKRIINRIMYLKKKGFKAKKYFKDSQNKNKDFIISNYKHLDDKTNSIFQKGENSNISDNFDLNDANENAF